LLCGGRRYDDGRGTFLNTLRDLDADVSAGGASARGLLRVGAPVELERSRIAALLAAFTDRQLGIGTLKTIS
jgi:DNA-binding transcriptional LysR family regulator